MAEYTFSGDASNLHMGPVAVYYEIEGTEKCLGYTLNDSVSFNVTHNPTPITPDQSSLPIKDIITEMEATVTMILGEVTREHLKLIPGTSDNPTGAAAASGEEPDKVIFYDPIGIDMKSRASKLTLIPMDESDTNIYTFPKASPYMSGDLSFVKNTPQGLSLTFKVYVNDDDDAQDTVTINNDTRYPYLVITKDTTKGTESNA